MDTAVIHSRATVGVEAPEVTIEAHLSGGLPRFNIVGLPETVVMESKDRVRSAILNSGFEFPRHRITVNLAPADLPKEGSRFDLPIALGILAAAGRLDREVLDRHELVGELALDGGLRRIHGVLPIAIALRDSQRALVVPVSNAAEATLVSGVTVLGARSLNDVCAHVNGAAPLAVCTPARVLAQAAQVEDLADVRGQHGARRALEVAAAGGHNLLMIGPPGTGKTMLAQRLPGILPPMSETEALESAAVLSVAGRRVDPQCWCRRPFRAPHHSASAPALVGGGGNPRPGEISLAHNGVLFLDELPEFDRQVLEALREPLEEGRITVARAARRATFPARVLLVAAMNPCPCGLLGAASGACRCTAEQVRRYRARISGPLLDRIDLHVEVPPLPQAALFDPATVGEPSAVVRERVAGAHARQIERQGKRNALLGTAEIERCCALGPAQQRLLAQAVERLGLSARAVQRVRRVARTIADLAGRDAIDTADLAEALGYRRLDRGYAAWQ